MTPLILRTAVLGLSLGLAIPALAADNDWQSEVAKALGKSGTDTPGGVYRVALPRTDIKATLDGVELAPQCFGHELRRASRCFQQPRSGQHYHQALMSRFHQLRTRPFAERGRWGRGATSLTME
jgi:hypothetical protein